MRQGRRRLRIFLNLKHIFAPFAFVYFYYLQNDLKYKTLLFKIHSVVINHVFIGDNPQVRDPVPLTHPPGIDRALSIMKSVAY